MPLFIAVSYETLEDTAILFEKMMLYEHIEYVSIIPHRIFVGDCIRYIIDGNVICCQVSNALDSHRFLVDSLNDLFPMFNAFNPCENITCFFVQFTTKMSYMDALKIIENISVKLDQM